MVEYIEKQAAIDAIRASRMIYSGTWGKGLVMAEERLRDLPSAQPEQRYTEEELRVFQHGISLSLLSKRSSQHWQYDEDTATEIKFLERLYEKVVADMRGEQDGRFNQQTGGVLDAMEAVEDIPAADVVEVVRCKDCDVPHNKWTGCPYMNGLIPPPNHFCSYGERK